MQSQVQVGESTDSRTTFGEDTKTFEAAGCRLGGEDLERTTGEGRPHSEIKCMGFSNRLDGSEDKLVRCVEYISEEQTQSDVDEDEVDEDLKENPFAEFD